MPTCSGVTTEAQLAECLKDTEGSGDYGARGKWPFLQRLAGGT